jgi:hypothetical protein
LRGLLSVLAYAVSVLGAVILILAAIYGLGVIVLGGLL